MKKLLIVCFTLISFRTAAQQTEYSLHLGSGLFSFGGESAQNTSFINQNYTNNPYGTKSGFSYSICAQIQRATKWNFIYGLQAGYESLSSKIMINDVYLDDMIFSVNEQTILTNQFININPFLGYRFKLGIPLDLTAGADYGLGISSKERAETFSPDVTVDNERKIPGLDFRLRFGLATYYKKVGFNVGYSYGLTNYTAEMIGANRENYSRFIRFGISYKIN
ncbi:outer membrane beta-barrel protein [Solitalea sp. MAHUQ-68]|uniref:Outer membrane beta-barrel protein n=1 Tax=Solitalea agri TaxID=2953739 RepID=A0A9X2FDB3_9SPHI|nr:outer membrane beta-barrel protein [Solitalea agri]MCO4294748.1 outer membrane beta-barrel protein [Solitalea agri]